MGTIGLRHHTRLSSWILEYKILQLPLRPGKGWLPSFCVSSHATVPSVLLLLVFQLLEPVRRLALKGVGKAASSADVALLFPFRGPFNTSLTCSGSYSPDHSTQSRLCLHLSAPFVSAFVTFYLYNFITTGTTQHPHVPLLISREPGGRCTVTCGMETRWPELPVSGACGRCTKAVNEAWGEHCSWRQWRRAALKPKSLRRCTTQLH